MGTASLDGWMQQLNSSQDYSLFLNTEILLLLQLQEITKELFTSIHFVYNSTGKQQLCK